MTAFKLLRGQTAAFLMSEIKPEKPINRKNSKFYILSYKDTYMLKWKASQKKKANLLITKK